MKFNFKSRFKIGQKVRIGEQRRVGIIKNITSNFIVVNFGNYNESFNYGQLIVKKGGRKK